MTAPTRPNGSRWAREALDSGEITPEQFQAAVEGGVRLMEQIRQIKAETADVWEPAPDGPPPTHQPNTRFVALRRWCKDNPGQWAKIPESHTTVAARFRHDGFDAVSRNTRVIDGNKRVDVYVRWLTQGDLLG